MNDAEAAVWMIGVMFVSLVALAAILAWIASKDRQP